MDALIFHRNDVDLAPPTDKFPFENAVMQFFKAFGGMRLTDVSDIAPVVLLIRNFLSVWRLSVPDNADHILLSRKTFIIFRELSVFRRF